MGLATDKLGVWLLFFSGLLVGSSCTPPTPEELAYQAIMEAPEISQINDFIDEFKQSQYIFKLIPVRDSMLVAHYQACDDCDCTEIGEQKGSVLTRFVAAMDELHEACLYRSLQRSPSRYLANQYLEAYPEGQHAAWVRQELAYYTRIQLQLFEQGLVKSVTTPLAQAMSQLLRYQLAHPEARIWVSFDTDNEYVAWSEYSDSERESIIELYEYTVPGQSLYEYPVKSPKTDRNPPLKPTAFAGALAGCDHCRSLNFQFMEEEASHKATVEDVRITIKSTFRNEMIPTTPIPIIYPVKSGRVKNFTGEAFGSKNFDGYVFGIILQSEGQIEIPGQQAAKYTFAFDSQHGEYMHATEQPLLSSVGGKGLEVNPSYTDRPLYDRMEASCLNRLPYDLLATLGFEANSLERQLMEYMESGKLREALE